MSEIDRIIENLYKKFDKDLEEVAYKDAKPFVEDELKKSVVKNIYGRQESDIYDRTGMMYDSITGYARKTTNGLDICSEMDMTNSNPRHTSWVKPYGTSNKGTEIDEHLAFWAEYGTDYGLAPIEGTLMFAEAQQSINKRGAKLIKKKLKEKGYKVK